MALLYLYIFENNLPEGSPDRRDLGTGLVRPSLAVYAQSEAMARKCFEKDFGTEAGKLLGRHPW